LPTEQTRPFAPEAAFVPLASVSAEVVVLSPTFVSGGKKRPETPRLNVLLSKRSTPLRQDRWALPGALADGRRSLAEIAGEIVMKLTGVETPPPLFQLCAVGGPESRPGRFSVSCAYLALLRSPCLSDKSEAEECQWRRLSLPGEPKDLDDGEPVLTITSLPGDLDADALDFSVPSEDAASTEVLSSDLPLSFEHGRMIQAALLKIRANPLRHHAVRRLLPERFTLKHLQSFTELILGRNLLTPAFRRKIAPLVRPTDDFVRDKRFRPSRLFQFQEQKSEG
jgi:ADP-ribose pyrophosphatase YjhB (NUDIX family)